uniref:Uncharacterized protein n=1 Tax=Bracon brevicornis TaxID=1563983 RepID=A0A6V7J8E9_9HYME
MSDVDSLMETSIENTVASDQFPDSEMDIEVLGNVNQWYESEGQFLSNSQVEEIFDTGYGSNTSDSRTVYTEQPNIVDDDFPGEARIENTVQIGLSDTSFDEEILNNVNQWYRTEGKFLTNAQTERIFCDESENNDISDGDRELLNSIHQWFETRRRFLETDEVTRNLPPSQPTETQNDSSVIIASPQGQFLSELDLGNNAVNQRIASNDRCATPVEECEIQDNSENQPSTSHQTGGRSGPLSFVESLEDKCGWFNMELQIDKFMIKPVPEGVAVAEWISRAFRELFQCMRNAV